MANFATESDVRLKFQLEDTTLVPSALVTESIDHAHAVILGRLDPQYDVQPPDTDLALGETLLSGSRLLQSLASKEAFDQKDVTIGGQRIASGKRFATLMAMASTAEAEAWRMLAPFLVDCPARTVIEVNETTPVLGEE